MRKRSLEKENCVRAMKTLVLAIRLKLNYDKWWLKPNVVGVYGCAKPGSFRIPSKKQFFYVQLMNHQHIHYIKNRKNVMNLIKTFCHILEIDIWFIILFELGFPYSFGANTCKFGFLKEKFEIFLFGYIEHTFHHTLFYQRGWYRGD